MICNDQIVFRLHFQFLNIWSFALGFHWFRFLLNLHALSFAFGLPCLGYFIFGFSLYIWISALSSLEGPERKSFSEKIRDFAKFAQFLAGFVEKAFVYG